MKVGWDRIGSAVTVAAVMLATHRTRLGGKSHNRLRTPSCARAPNRYIRYV
jgi:hypothetical protein